METIKHSSNVKSWGCSGPSNSSVIGAFGFGSSVSGPKCLHNAVHLSHISTAPIPICS